MSVARPPLDGVRAVEIVEGLAVPFAARLLADAGADLVKVESSTGDRTRLVEPWYRTETGESRSALFEYLNWNKRGVSLDPAQGRGELAGLLESAEILLVGDDVDLWSRWGLRPEQLRAEHPDLVVVSLSPFGLTGPKAGWSASDLVLQAAAGLMSFSGTAGRPPLKRGLRQSTYETGLTAAYVALSGLLAARGGQGGVFADVSMMECLTSELVLSVPEYTFIGAVSSRRPAVLDPFSTGDPLPTGEGYVAVQTNSMTPVRRYAEFIGDSRLLEERFQTSESRAVNADELTEIMRAALVGVRPRDFFERAAAEGLLTGFVQTAAQLLDCPQLAAREVFVDMPGTLNGRPWRMPFRSVVLSEAPLAYRRIAPTLGEHNDEIVPPSESTR